MSRHLFDPFPDVPDHLKMGGPMWAAKFNPTISRTFDLTLRQSLSLDITCVCCARISADGSLLAVGAEDEVRIYSTDTGRMTCELRCGSSERGRRALVRAMSFLSDSQALAAAGDDTFIRLWETNRCSVVRVLVGHEAAVTCLDLNKDSKLLVSGSEDKTVRIWDLGSGRQVAKCVLDSSVTSISVCSDVKVLAVGTLHGAVLLDGSTCDRIGVVGSHQGDGDAVYSVSYSPDGRQLATASSDKTVRVWNMSRDGTRAYLLHRIDGHEDLALSVCWAMEGRWLISGSKDKCVLISDADIGRTQATIRAHDNSVLSIASSDSRCLFATAGADFGRVNLWSYSLHHQRGTTPLVELRTAASPSQAGFMRPGSGLPLHFLPPSRDRFPVLLGSQDRDWTAATLLIREVCMLKMLDELTDKPEWWRKVRDPNVAARWRDEAMTLNWSAYRRYGDFTAAMANTCVAELQKKAKLYEDTSLIPVFDYSACVIKSDSIGSDLFDELKSAVTPLENVPEHHKDWHPGSDGKVLDLVHPSLWPLVYGRTRILTDQTCNVLNCIDYAGRGEVLPRPSASELVTHQQWPLRDDALSIPSLSLSFQWLPCDIAIDEHGRSKIESYINNLNPAEHAELYVIINSFIEQSLPAWDLIYRWPNEFSFQRLKAYKVRPVCTTPDICEYGCFPWNRPLNDGEPERDEDEEYNMGNENHCIHGPLDHQWFDITHPVPVPDAQPEESLKQDRFFHLNAQDVKSSGFFNGSTRIQVIVKLANIHLTPKNPTYDGGSWHIEGQLNEHICATALFYYDSDNITDSRLAFRTKSNSEELDTGLSYQQCDYRSIGRTFAIDPRPGYDSTVQEIGSVLTRTGRAVLFPNLYQHRVQPFCLADKSRPGHRKILALFLVDPAIPIISTAQVPPQQPHWRGGSWDEVAADGIYWEEAVRIRDELMRERSALQRRTTEKYEEATFNFCEH